MLYFIFHFLATQCESFYIFSFVACNNSKKLVFCTRRMAFTFWKWSLNIALRNMKLNNFFSSPNIESIADVPTTTTAITAISSSQKLCEMETFGSAKYHFNLRLMKLPIALVISLQKWQSSSNIDIVVFVIQKL